MELSDLQKSLSQMTDEELEELLREIRHNKTNENIIAKKEKQSKEKSNNLEKMMKGLSPEQLKQLMEAFKS